MSNLDPIPESPLAIIQYTFELDVPKGVIRVDQPEPFDADLKTLISNAMGLLAASSGVRGMTVVASNPLVDRARQGGIRPAGNGQS